MNNNPYSDVYRVLLLIGLVIVLFLEGFSEGGILGGIIIIPVGFGMLWLVGWIGSFFNGEHKKKKELAKQKAEAAKVEESNQVQKETVVNHNESFEDQLKKMEEHVKAIRGANYKSKQVFKNLQTRSDSDYYSSVEEALADYTIPDSYQKIMIERIQNTDVVECPGLVWKDAMSLYVLPLTRKTKVYSWPCTSIPVILYEKRKQSDSSVAFSKLSKETIMKEFKRLLPSKLSGDDGIYFGKFILPIGLEVTNTSGKALFKMLSVKLHVVDNVMNSTSYVEEIKELYLKNILKENKVITPRRYEIERDKLLTEYELRENDHTKYEKQLNAAKKLGLI